MLQCTNREESDLSPVTVEVKLLDHVMKICLRFKAGCISFAHSFALSPYWGHVTRRNSYKKRGDKYQIQCLFIICFPQQRH